MTNWVQASPDEELTIGELPKMQSYVHKVILSDETQVGERRWKDVKENVIKENYKELDWWGSLSGQQKLQIEELRMAQ